MQVNLDEFSGSLKHLSVSTRLAYVRDVARFLDFLAQTGTDVSEVKPPIIRRYLDVLQVGARAANRYLSAITALYVYLAEIEAVEINPAAGLRRWRVVKQKPQFLRSHEVDRLRQACPDILWRTVVETFYLTGIRLEELRTCSIDNLSLERREMKVVGKGGKERFVPLPKSCLPLLSEYLAWRAGVVKADVKQLFVSQRGEALSRSQVDYRIDKTGRRAGLKVHPHKLRHTFATEAIEKGMSRDEVKEILGHATIATTDWYVHITPNVKQSYDKAYP